MWKGNYALEENLQFSSQMLFYHQNQCFHLIAQIGGECNYIYIFLSCVTNFLN